MGESGPRREIGLPIDRLDLPEGFRPPDWTAPFHLQAHLAQIPDDATVKGMFLSSTVETVRERSGRLLTDEKFTAFRDYPLGRTLELLVAGAGIVYPDRPVRDGMRRLSRPAFSVFSATMIGRAVFAAIGREPRPILGLASRAWRHATSMGKLRSETVDEHAVMIHAEDFLLTEMVAVGIAEGVLQACDRPGQVACRAHSPTAFDFLIRWT